MHYTAFILQVGDWPTVRVLSLMRQGAFRLWPRAVCFDNFQHVKTKLGQFHFAAQHSKVVVPCFKDVLDDVLKSLKDAKPRDIGAWWKQIGEWRAKDCLRYDRKSAIIKPQFVLEKLYEVTKGEAFITSDVGQHQMWAAQFYGFQEPNRWMTSGGLGTMGYGLPAAVGVKVLEIVQRDRLPERAYVRLSTFAPFLSFELLS